MDRKGLISSKNILRNLFSIKIENLTSGVMLLLQQSMVTCKVIGIMRDTWERVAKTSILRMSLIDLFTWPMMLSKRNLMTMENLSQEIK